MGCMHGHFRGCTKVPQCLNNRDCLTFSGPRLHPSHTWKLFFQILLSAALNSWCTHAKEQKLTDKMHTAWKAFLGQVFSLMKLPPGPPCSVQGEVTSIRNQLKVQFAKDEKSEAEIPEMWQNR